MNNLKLKNNQNSIIFIDHHILVTGKLIKGRYSGAEIDFPTYRFDQDAKVLQGRIDFKIDKNLMVIYGDGISLSGIAGGGTSTRLFGIYKLPYTSQGYDTPQLTVLKIQDDGSVELEYRKENFTLQIGEKWEKIFTKLEDFKQYQQNGTIEFINTDRIFNYGFLKKSKINNW